MYALILAYSIAYHAVYYAGWIYFLELMPQRYHNAMIIIGSVGSASSVIFGSVFFLEVSSQQNHLLMFNLALAVLILAGLTVVKEVSKWFPESPKYFYMIGNYHRAR
jgi:hypothetical protein